MTINIPATCTTGTILPLVKEEIHFDSLLEQAEDVLDAQAAKTWTDKEDHDPGITLLQALCFGVSDLAYRHTLPLTDLLTPPDPSPGAGIFPIAFGPQQALTCGPVTVDDYRRALLDLHTPPEERINVADAATLDRFGSAVSISASGDIMVIGAPGKAGGGIVYRFMRDGRSWKPLDPLSAPDELCSNFGAWISLSGDGRWLVTTADTANIKSIYLYEYTNDSWGEPNVISPPTVDFGFALSFSADDLTLAVSALQADSEADGYIYVYRYEGEQWIQKGEPLTREGNAFPYSGFGSALSLNADGTILAVGAPWTDSSVGEVWIFDLSGEEISWQLTAERITAGDGVACKFGLQVCLNAVGDMLVIRAPGENYLSRSAIYCCYYSSDGDSLKWHVPKKIVDGYISGDRYSGMSLNGQGTVLTLSHPGVAGAGAVYVWGHNHGQWNAPRDPIVAVDAGPGDEFACAVSLNEDGTVLAIGARNMDVDWQTNSGAAYVFHGDEIRQKWQQTEIGKDETLQYDGYFYLRDAQLVKETPDEQYHYWYNTETREFLFKKENGDDETLYQPMSVLGGYHLYLELSRHADRTLAESAVTLFLENHRNLCEHVNKITWLEPEVVDVNIVIELDDDCQQYARVMAQIFTVTEAFVSPSAQRYSAADLVSQGFDNDTIYQGPRLQYGWIPELQPAPDYGNRQHVNISLLANKLLAIEGIRSINKLYFENSDKEPSWDWYASAQNKSLRLWGESPYETLAAHEGPVRLLKRGQIVFPLPEGDKSRLTPEDIEKEQELPVLVHESSMLLPYGLWRRPGQYYPVSQLIPPCYGLQQTDSDPLQIQLHQYLLPYEQIISDGCQQLAMLPQLLAFDRDDQAGNGDATIWGGQWPFPPRPSGEIDIPNEVHKDYEGNLKELLKVQRQDNDKELALIDYLLGYFGNSRAARILQTGTEEEFLAVQRYYLAQMTELTYDRTSFRVDALSAFQRRIAARLGWGGALFSSSNIERMPFYIIEHRSLLPSMPDPMYDHAMLVTEVEESELFLLLTSSEGGRLLPGQWINLMISVSAGDPSDYYDIFTNVLVKSSILNETTGKYVITVDLAQHERLKLNTGAIKIAASEGKLFWENCNVWLYDMLYPLSYDSNVQQTRSGFKQLNADPYPATMKVGDWIVVKPSDSPISNVASEQSKRARVSKVYPLTKTFVVEDAVLPIDPSGYVWYLDKDVIEDRFSFVVSVVFDNNLLKNVEEQNSAIDWIKQIIQEEIPCHISAQVHWLDFDAGTNSFPELYSKWYNDGKPSGDLAYDLLDILGLGQQQPVQQGIGTMRIATPAQRTEVIGGDENEWDESKRKQYELFYVPLS